MLYFVTVRPFVNSNPPHAHLAVMCGPLEGILLDQAAYQRMIGQLSLEIRRLNRHRVRKIKIQVRPAEKGYLVEVEDHVAIFLRQVDVCYIQGQAEFPEDFFSL